MTVALGGTFDPVHDGHRALFETAFALGDVVVGLTTDEFAAEIRGDSRPVRPWEDRRRALAAELAEYADRFDRSFEIKPLESATGIATDPKYTDLVVSPETEANGRRINELREEHGVDPMRIHVVDHVRDERGEIISSTRILRGEIDAHGRILGDERAGEQAQER